MKQSLRWTPQGRRDMGRPKNMWKRTLEKEMGRWWHEQRWRRLKFTWVLSATHVPPGNEGKEEEKKEEEEEVVVVVVVVEVYVKTICLYFIGEQIAFGLDGFCSITVFVDWKRHVLLLIPFHRPHVMQQYHAGGSTPACLLLSPSSEWQRSAPYTRLFNISHAESAHVLH